ncbi:MAG: tyrosine-type recombinase/integrase [Saprospiraceae bacterium]|nr:tyrosine-type recombinase/integrase [Saprospiraceae bacterium]
MIDTFTSYLAKVKKYSEHTIISYANDLNQFSHYLLEVYGNGDILLAGHLMVRSWVVSLSKNEITPRSVNRKLSALNSFYKYALKHGHVQKNPMKKVAAPKVGKRLPSYVMEDEIPVVMAATDMQADNYTQWRDKTILFLLYTTGMRRSELLQLRVEDLNVSRKEIRVLGKGKKERIVPMPADSIRFLNEYLEVRKEHFKDKEIEASYLLLSGKGKKLDPRTVYGIVNQYLKLAPSAEKKSPHVLRHSFATHLLNNGADINAIKELLGHANLGATQVYTHNSIERLKEIYQKFHPKA